MSSPQRARRTSRDLVYDGNNPSQPDPGPTRDTAFGCEGHHRVRMTGTHIRGGNLDASYIVLDDLLVIADGLFRSNSVSERPTYHDARMRTQHDNMDPRIRELLRQRCPRLPRPIVRVVYHDLPTSMEEVPDQLLAALQDLLAQFVRRLTAFAAYTRINKR